MKLDDGLTKAKVIRISIAVFILLVIILAIGVYASKNDLNYITIKFSDDTQISVVTSKTTVAEVLEENNIVLLTDEEARPSLNSNIDASKTIVISKIKNESVVKAGEKNQITTDQILEKHVTVREEVLVEQVEIPFETVTKDVSEEGTETVDKVVQEGENGIKEVKYKVRYEDDVEVNRTVIEETVIKEPVERIVQISTKIVSRSDGYRTHSATTLEATASMGEPEATVLNVSAYTADNTWGDMTACGAHASTWYTVAAGPSIPFGTIMYIPYFADEPNGGWFVVQDRGGAITDRHLDVYMATESACEAFGRRNLEVYIYY